MIEIERTCEELKKVLIEKNKAYGNSVADRPRLCPHIGQRTAILVRMTDKINRLESLANGSNDNGETFDDTVLDLAGYCVLYLASKSRTQTYEQKLNDITDALAAIDAGVDEI